MAKSIRSKIKRKNRAEFRNTIGADAAKKNMEVIQEKLRGLIQQGSMMPSAQHVSSLLDVSNDNDDDGDDEDEISTSAMDVSSTNLEDKIIPRKVNPRKKRWVENTAGQSGARLARKVISRAKSHGKWKNGSFVNNAKARPVRKNKYKCAF